MAYEASQITDSADAATGGTSASGTETAEATAAGTSAISAREAAAEPAPDDLLGELARAMHLAASSQYGRMNAELERLRTEHVEAIAARAASEAEGLKSDAEADIRAIDAWAKAEAEKIKLERLRRIDARREQLSVQLDRQETIRQREVLAIEVAIDAHRHEIDAFFGRMEREADPATIAQVASTMPPLPPLAEIAEDARRSASAEFGALGPPSASSAEQAPGEAATASTVEEPAAAEPAPEAQPASAETPPEASVGEPPPVPVMDPDLKRGDAEAAQPWEAPYAVMVAAGSVSPDAAPPAEPEASSRVGSTLLRTVRAIRPMSGERHDRKSEER